MSLFRITDMDSLHRHLYAALQLEHATIPLYLTALYSIKPGTNSEGFHILRAVAVEEMLHLTLVGNLINAIGGKPDLTTPGFVPRYPAYLPDGEEDFSVSLQKFSPEAIESFLKIERPASLGTVHGNLNRRSRKPHLLSAGHPGRDDEEHFFSIGEFYKAIEAGLDHLHAEMGAALFSGDPARQIGPEQYYSGGGAIVNVGSILGSIGFPHFAAYSASKFALRGFSEALRRELSGTGVGVTYVAPRTTRTAFNSDMLYKVSAESGSAVDDPATVAAIILEAIVHDRDEIYIGWPEKLAVRLNALLPGAVSAAISKQAAAARRLLRGQAQTIVGIHHRLQTARVFGAPFGNVCIVQHPQQFFPHRSGGQPAQLPAFQGLQ